MDEHPLDYERLCRNLYAYQFGTIGFLELVGHFEVVLGIRLSDEHEAMDADGVLVERERE